MTAQSHAVAPERSEESKPDRKFGYFQKALGWVGITITLFIALLVLWEWARIAIISDPKEIAGYYFGSEAMIVHGGWKYQSASTYAWVCFAEGLFYICASATFLHSTVKKYSCRIYLIYAVLLIFVAYSWFS